MRFRDRSGRQMKPLLIYSRAPSGALQHCSVSLHRQSAESAPEASTSSLPTRLAGARLRQSGRAAPGAGHPPWLQDIAPAAGPGLKTRSACFAKRAPRSSPTRPAPRAPAGGVEVGASHPTRLTPPPTLTTAAYPVCWVRHAQDCRTADSARATALRRTGDIAPGRADDAGRRWQALPLAGTGRSRQARFPGGGGPDPRRSWA